MDSNPKEESKQAQPAKQPMALNTNLKSFKPNLNLKSTAFVPSVKPDIAFTPEKVAKKTEEKKAEISAPIKFNLDPKPSLNPNAPVFTPTVPLDSLPQPTMSKSKKKRNKKKSQKEGEKPEGGEPKEAEEKPAN